MLKELQLAIEQLAPYANGTAIGQLAMISNFNLKGPSDAIESTSYLH